MRKMGLFKPLYPIGEGCDIMCNNCIDNLSPYIPLGNHTNNWLVSSNYLF